MELLSQFHFLRPAWLLLLIPALLLFFLLLKRRLNAGHWARVIDEHLLPHVLDRSLQSHNGRSLWLILSAWLLASLALAGPLVFAWVDADRVAVSFPPALSLLVQDDTWHHQ